MKQQPVLRNVAEWFRKHPGEMIHYSALANQLGLNAGSVAGACARLAATNDITKSPQRGMYINRGRNADARILKLGDMLEVMGYSQSGQAIAKDEQERLYIVKEI